MGEFWQCPLWHSGWKRLPSISFRGSVVDSGYPALSSYNKINHHITCNLATLPLALACHIHQLNQPHYICIYLCLVESVLVIRPMYIATSACSQCPFQFNPRKCVKSNKSLEINWCQSVIKHSLVPGGNVVSGCYNSISLLGSRLNKKIVSYE